jgi:tRNA-dihydrouridine synthase C
MLARGALCRPDLALSVRATLLGEVHKPLAWEDVRLLLIDYLARNASTYEVRHACNPTKQWLVYLQYYYPQAGELFARVKRINDFDAMISALEQSEASRADDPTFINAA